jgi:plasmid stabilization system protein ParE
VIPVHLSARAESDFFARVTWLSERSTRRAVQFIDSFEGVLEDLRQFPELGTVAADGRTRILKRGGLRYLYVHVEGRVILLRLLDPRRVGQD